MTRTMGTAPAPDLIRGLNCEVPGQARDSEKLTPLGLLTVTKRGVGKRESCLCHWDTSTDRPGSARPAGHVWVAWFEANSATIALFDPEHRSASPVGAGLALPGLRSDGTIGNLYALPRT